MQSLAQTVGDLSNRVATVESTAIKRLDKKVSILEHKMKAVEIVNNGTTLSLAAAVGAETLSESEAEEPHNVDDGSEDRLQALEQAFYQMEDNVRHLEAQVAAKSEEEQHQQQRAPGAGQSHGGMQPPPVGIERLGAGMQALHLQMQQLGQQVGALSGEWEVAQEGLLTAQQTGSRTKAEVQQMAKTLELLGQRVEGLESRDGSRRITNPLFDNCASSEPGANGMLPEGLVDMVLGSAQLEVLIQTQVEQLLQQEVEGRVAAAVASAMGAVSPFSAAAAPKQGSGVSDWYSVDGETAAAGDPLQQQQQSQPEVIRLQETVELLQQQVQQLQEQQQGPKEEEGDQGNGEIITPRLEKTLTDLQESMAAMTAAEAMGQRLDDQQEVMEALTARLSLIEHLQQQLHEEQEKTRATLQDSNNPSLVKEQLVQLQHQSSVTAQEHGELVAVAAAGMAGLEASVQMLAKQLAALQTQEETASSKAAAALASLQEQDLPALQGALASIQQQAAVFEQQQQEHKARLQVLEQPSELACAVHKLGEQLQEAKLGHEAARQVIQEEIEQLSQQLAGVNEHAVDEDDLQLVRDELQEVKEQLEGLQSKAAEAGDVAQLAEQVGLLASKVAHVVGIVEDMPGLREVKAEMAEVKQQLGQFAGLSSVKALGEQVELLMEKVGQVLEVVGVVQQLGEQVEGLVQLKQQVADAQQALTRAVEAAEQIPVLSAGLEELQDGCNATANGLADVRERVVQANDELKALVSKQGHLTKQLMKQEEALEQQLAELKGQAASRETGLKEEVQQRIREAGDQLQELLQQSLAAMGVLTERLEGLEVAHQEALQQLDATADAQEGRLRQQLTSQVEAAGKHLQALADDTTAAQVLLRQRIEAREVEWAAQLEQIKGVAEEKDCALRGQLREQVATMAQLLADVGATKAEQQVAMNELRGKLGQLEGQQNGAADKLVEVQAAMSQQLEQASSALRQLVQQEVVGEEGLKGVVGRLEAKQGEIEGQVAAQGEALEGCAKSSSLAGVMATVRSLTGGVDSLKDVVEQLAAAQVRRWE